MAVAGTQDPGYSPGSEDCNTADSGGLVETTGERANCVSNFGANDMVGNLYEFVGDWLQLPTACPAPVFGGDENCLAGASTTTGPVSLTRGGYFGSGSGAGPFAVNTFQLGNLASYIGFRGAR